MMTAHTESILPSRTNRNTQRPAPLPRSLSRATRPRLLSSGACSVATLMFFFDLVRPYERAVFVAAMSW